MRSMWGVFVSLTTQADCTASDTLPALGSHQNTWHWKCWFPVSMMNANVWTSRPTPMKDRKRTRHSTMTSSSSSCPNRTETTVINLSVSCHQRWITFTGLWMFYQGPSRKRRAGFLCSEFVLGLSWRPCGQGFVSSWYFKLKLYRWSSH